MTDDAPLNEAEFARIEAVTRKAAAHIIAGFDAEQVPTEIALAICGVVVGDLLDRCDAGFRREFIVCLEVRGRKGRP